MKRTSKGVDRGSSIARGAAIGFFLLLPALARTSPTPSPRSDPARIVRQEARWVGLGGNDPLQSDEASYYVISGEIRNDSKRPMAAIKIVYELVDELGAVVASEYGYNHRAEDLRDPRYEAGEIGREELQLEVLPPGEIDLFRMLFVRSDVRRFRSWRVRVSEIEYAQEREKTRKY